MYNSDQISNLDKKLDAIGVYINSLNIYLEQLTSEKENIGEWISENEAKRLTGLSKSTLLKLRKEGRIRSSTLSGKKIFYRRSDFNNLLDKNEQKR